MIKLSRNELVQKVQKKREGRMTYADVQRKPLLDCLMYEKENDELLKNFFEILEGHLSDIREASKSDLNREAMKIHEQIQRFAAKKEWIVANLRSRGYSVIENVLGPSYTLKIGNDYKRYEYDYAYRFSGTEVKKEMLTNPQDTTAKDKYEAAVTRIPERMEKIKELKKELRRKRFFGIFTTPGRQARKDERTDLKIKIENEQLCIKAVEIYERDYNFFKNLSQEERKLLIQYFEVNDAIRKGERAIDKCQKLASERIASLDTMDLMNQAFDRMQANGWIEEDFERVFERIDEIAQKRRFGFYDKLRTSSYRMADKKFFLKEVYGFDEDEEVRKVKARENSFVQTRE